MNELIYYYNELKDRRVGYTNKTLFLIQSGAGRSEYKTRCKVVGDLDKAFERYNAIVLCGKMKKRLLMKDAKQPIIAREIS